MVLVCQSSSAPAGLGPKENDTAITGSDLARTDRGTPDPAWPARDRPGGLQVLQVVVRRRNSDELKGLNRAVFVFLGLAETDTAQE